MPIRKYKPTSPGARFRTVQTFDEITSTDPYKPLTENLNRTGGRNNHGEPKSWGRGGGQKRPYPINHFNPDKKNNPNRKSTRPESRHNPLSRKPAFS